MLTSWTSDGTDLILSIMRMAWLTVVVLVLMIRWTARPCLGRSSGSLMRLVKVNLLGLMLLLGNDFVRLIMNRLLLTSAANRMLMTGFGLQTRVTLSVLPTMVLDSMLLKTLATRRMTLGQWLCMVRITVGVNAVVTSRGVTVTDMWFCGALFEAVMVLWACLTSGRTVTVRWHRASFVVAGVIFRPSWTSSRRWNLVLREVIRRSSVGRVTRSVSVVPATSLALMTPMKQVSPCALTYYFWIVRYR